MTGVYELDAREWALPFPITLSVKPRHDRKMLSVRLLDRDRPPKFFNYRGPLVGVGGDDALEDLVRWFSAHGDSGGLNVEAVHVVGSLLAALWADAFVHEPIDINRKEPEAN